MRFEAPEAVNIPVFVVWVVTPRGLDRYIDTNEKKTVVCTNRGIFPPSPPKSDCSGDEYGIRWYKCYVQMHSLPVRAARRVRQLGNSPLARHMQGRKINKINEI
jgi:hypothetical protein